MCKQRNTAGAIIVGLAHSNFLIFGWPLLILMYPDADRSILTLLVLAIFLLSNAMSVLVLVLLDNEKFSVGKILQKIFFSLLIIPILLGLFCGSSRSSSPARWSGRFAWLARSPLRLP